MQKKKKKTVLKKDDCSSKDSFDKLQISIPLFLPSGESRQCYDSQLVPEKNKEKQL